jgi:hypothetical protein
MGVKKIRDIKLRFFSFLQLKNVCLANRRVDIKSKTLMYSLLHFDYGTSNSFYEN